MTQWEAIVLGIIQAITEFLPISSDGHLAVAQYLLGLHEPMLAFDVLLHVGSLVAVLIYYRKRIGRLAVSLVAPAREPGGRRLIGMIVVASIPTAIIGLGFENLIEELFLSPVAAAMFWLMTAALLFAASKTSKGEKSIEQISVGESLLIGLFQGLAILPGLSRSGSTVAAGMFCGYKPSEAAEFSFLIYIPAILGATVLKLGDLAGASSDEMRIYFVATVVTAIVSYLAITMLIKLLQRRVIQPFAWYLVAVASVMLIAMAVRG